MDVCTTTEPAFLSEGNHQIACWWAEKNPGVTVPMEVTTV
jgi:hypothetical protein